MAETIAKAEAARVLETDRTELLSLLDRLPPRAMTTTGLGGGEWSPKDLLGHLESWEEHALGALEAWSRGARAPIDAAFARTSVAGLNADEVARKARRSVPATRTHAERTHARLLAAIRDLSDEAWEAPATPRGRKPLGHRLGSILGGPAGSFRHDAAHLQDVRAFVGLHGG